MKHLTYDELNRRIGINFQLRTAVHERMIDPATCQPRISPLSEEWAAAAAEFAALAAESERLYEALCQMEGVPFPRREAVHA